MNMNKSYIRQLAITLVTESSTTTTFKLINVLLNSLGIEPLPKLVTPPKINMSGRTTRSDDHIMAFLTAGKGIELHNESSKVTDEDIIGITLHQLHKFKPADKMNIDFKINEKDIYHVSQFELNKEIRYITVCGAYLRHKGKDEDTVNLRIGMAISNPMDEYKEDVGKKIAKHRASNSPVASFNHTAENILLTTKVVNDLLKTVADRVISNPDKFITALKVKKNNLIKS